MQVQGYAIAGVNLMQTELFAYVMVCEKICTVHRYKHLSHDQEPNFLKIFFPF